MNQLEIWEAKNRVIESKCSIDEITPRLGTVKERTRELSWKLELEKFTQHASQIYIYIYDNGETRKVD